MFAGDRQRASRVVLWIFVWMMVCFQVFVVLF
jgi:hypothetical protein